PRLHRTCANGGRHSARRPAARDRRRQGKTLRTRRALPRGAVDPLPSSSPPHLPRRRAHPADSSDRPPRPCRNDRDRRPMNMTNDNSSRAETKEGTAEVVSVSAESVCPDTVEKYDRESRTRDAWSTNWSLPLTAFAVGLSLYQIYYSLFGGPPPLVHRGILVGAILVLCFAIQRFRLSEKRRTPPWYDWLFMAGSVAIAVYLGLVFQKLAVSGGRFDTIDVVFSVMALVLVLEASRRVTGPVLPILAILFVVYDYY